jgi:succinyl-diaminopimelate desuccinylase
LGGFLELSKLHELGLYILSESIKYKTVLGEQYEDLVDFYREVLSEHGVHVTVHRVPDEYVKKHLPERFNPDKPRYILLARVGSGDRVLQFNGHYDVVPPGEGWATDPFTPTIAEGKLYGRGATDMKGGIAAFLAAMIHYAEREPDIIVEGVLVPDEEIGGVTGTGYLVRELKSRPDWVVIAEPTGPTQLYNGHRGIVWFIVKVYGKQAHGSAPWLGDNAFEKMLVLAKRFIDEYRSILEGRVSSYSYEDPRAAKPTINPGGILLSPGAFNIVPGVSGFSVDRRLIVEESVEAVVEEVKRLVEKISAEIGVKAEVEVAQTSNPAYTPESSLIVSAVKRSALEVLGVDPKPVICTGGLDLRYYAEERIEAVAYGPGVIGLAHQPNEYIELAEFYKFIDVYIKLVEVIASARRV